MASITAWAVTMCFAAIALAAVGMLAPKESLGRLLRLISVAFFITVMISPLLKIKNLNGLGEINLPEILNEDYAEENSKSSEREMLENEMNIQFEKQVNETLTLVCRRILEEDVNPEAIKVETNMDRDQTGSIYIESVTVVLDKQDEAKTLEVARKLEDALNVKVNVRVER